MTRQTHVRSNFQVERKRWHDLAGNKRMAFDDHFWKHGDLAPWHVDRRQPGTRDAAEIGIRSETQTWRGNVYTYLHAAISVLSNGKSIVDFCGMSIINREGLNRRNRKITRVICRRMSRKGAAAHALTAFWKMLEKKTAEMVGMAIGKRAATPHQAYRRLATRGASRFERLGSLVCCDPICRAVAQ